MVLYPIYKKDDPQIHNNFTTTLLVYPQVALLNKAYKMLSYCVFDKIKPLTKVSFWESFWEISNIVYELTNQIFSIK